MSLKKYDNLDLLTGEAGLSTPHTPVVSPLTGLSLEPGEPQQIGVAYSSISTPTHSLEQMSGSNLLEPTNGGTNNGPQDYDIDFENLDLDAILGSGLTEAAANPAATSTTTNTIIFDNSQQQQQFINTPMSLDNTSNNSSVSDFQLFKETAEEKTVLAEVTLPVSNNSFEDLWNKNEVCSPMVQSFSTDPMACVNLMEVEGREEHQQQQVFPDLLATTSPQHQPQQVVVQETAYSVTFANPTAIKEEVVAAPPAAKRRRKILPKLVMPVAQAPAPVMAAPTGLDTPAIDQVMKQTAADSNFDLLDFVVNETLEPTDAGFLALVGDTSPSTSAGFPNVNEVEDVKTEPTEFVAVEDHDGDELYKPGPSRGKRKILKAKDKKSKTGRPRGRPPSATITSGALSAKDHAYESSSAVSADELKEVKYRRMRDLNNEASKRCRQNRKRKMGAKEMEEEALRTQNRELKSRCKQLEDLVSQLKKKFIEKVANPKRAPLDLNLIMAQRLMSEEKAN